MEKPKRVEVLASLRALPLKPMLSTQLPLALAFGVATNLLPWLLMFPSMGFGWFGRDAPAELLLIRTSFVNHTRCLAAGSRLPATRWAS
jgi:hypothetical protein